VIEEVEEEEEGTVNILGSTHEKRTTKKKERAKKELFLSENRAENSLNQRFFSYFSISEKDVLVLCMFLDSFFFFFLKRAVLCV